MQNVRHALVLPVLASLLVLPAATPAPAPVPLTAQPGTALDHAARDLAAQELAEAERAGDTPLLLVGSARLAGSRSDPALFLQLQSARECGSAGCNTLVYLPGRGGWRKVLDGVSGTVAVASTRRNGMRDLLVGADRYVWNGTRYVDARPAPAVNLRPARHPAAS